MYASSSSSADFTGFCCRIEGSDSGDCVWEEWIEHESGPCVTWVGILGGTFGCEEVRCDDYSDQNTPCSVIDDCEERMGEACARECETCTTTDTEFCLPCLNTSGEYECRRVTHLEGTYCNADCLCNDIIACQYIWSEEDEMYQIDEDNCDASECGPCPPTFPWSGPDPPSILWGPCPEG